MHYYKELFTLAALVPNLMVAQGECDSVTVVNVHWSAFEPGHILIEATGMENFDYPNFVLLNELDTVAMGEPVSFPVEDTWYWLSVMPDLDPASTQFDATIHLYNYFGMELSCIFEYSIDLCPTDCRDLELFVMNTSSTPVIANQNWMILQDGIQVVSGTTLFTPTEQQQLNEFCLEPGSYELVIAAPWSSDTTVLYKLRLPGMFNGPSIMAVPGMEFASLPFTYMLECVNDGTGIQGASDTDLQVTVFNGYLEVKGVAGQQLGTLEIYDVTGKLVLIKNISTDNASLDINGLAKGVHILRSISSAFSGSHSFVNP